MTYQLHYTSADRPGPDAPWSVYSEHYVNADAEEPIEGSTHKVSTHPTESAADIEAGRLQAGANKPGRYTFVGGDQSRVMCRDCSTRSTGVMIPADEIGEHDQWHNQEEA